MPSTRVFEDIASPGEGRPFYIEVLLDLVDADTRMLVREAYFEDKTIAGTTRAKINGGAPNWTLSQDRCQWEALLAPNADIIYKGSPGGTLWRRSMSSRSPYAYPGGSIKATKAYIDVPVSQARLIFGDLVAPSEEEMPSVDYTWDLVAGDLWNHTARYYEDELDADGNKVPQDKTGYTLELELRRSWRDMVRAEAVFDYTEAADGVIGMQMTSATTLPLFGTYVASLQEYDPDGERTTLADWAFKFGADR